MTIKHKITSAVAMGVMVASVVAPSAFAADTVDIKGNGAFSFNHAKIKNWSMKKVSQNNTNVVNTGISAKAKTGYNKSSFNTGGSNSITTGMATNSILVAVEGGHNTNTGDDCGCPEGSTDVTISNNGAYSHNGVHVMNSNHNSVKQSNTSVVSTYVSTSASTGGNSSSFNTGGGNTIETGHSSNMVEVIVGGSTNSN